MAELPDGPIKKFSMPPLVLPMLVNCAAGNVPTKLCALSACTAYGAGVRVRAGVNAANPSLNQINNCRPAWLNSDVGIAVMLDSVVSPNTTVNNPLLTATLTAAAGSLPLVPVPSLLHQVVVCPLVLVTSSNLNRPVPLNLLPLSVICPDR